MREYLKEIKELNDMTDEEILQASLKDPNSFEEIVRRYEKPFLRKAKRILGSNESAIDIVQETFVKIYIKAKKFKQVEGASFSSWAYKILLNNCFTEYKKLVKLNRAFVPLDESIENSMRDDGGYEKRFSIDYFLSVASKMPHALSRILKHVVLDGLSIDQIAKIEKSSVGAIRTRLHRAKKAFRKMDIELVS